MLSTWSESPKPQSPGPGPADLTDLSAASRLDALKDGLAPSSSPTGITRMNADEIKELPERLRSGKRVPLENLIQCTRALSENLVDLPTSFARVSSSSASPVSCSSWSNRALT